MGRVLLVDDDADIRESLRDLLTDEGYEVLCARDGREALDVLLAGERPSLIVLDLIMPVMDGVEFLTHLRADPDLASLPVVVASASSMVQPPPDTPLLRKPVNVDRLLELVERHSGNGSR